MNAALVSSSLVPHLKHHTDPSGWCTPKGTAWCTNATLAKALSVNAVYAYLVDRCSGLCPGMPRWPMYVASQCPLVNISLMCEMQTLLHNTTSLVLYCYLCRETHGLRVLEAFKKPCSASRSTAPPICSKAAVFDSRSKVASEFG